MTVFENSGAAFEAARRVFTGALLWAKHEGG